MGCLTAVFARQIVFPSSQDLDVLRGWGKSTEKERLYVELQCFRDLNYTNPNCVYKPF